MQPTQEYVSDKAIAAFTGLSIDFLRRDRITRRLIPFHKVGRRILYHIPSVQAMLAKTQQGGESGNETARG